MYRYKLHDVFLSYRRFEDDARTDDQGARIAETLYHYLTAKGLEVFWDRPEMETGSFVDQLQWQLEHCPSFIFIATENARRFRRVTPPEKDYVEEEVRYALEMLREEDRLPNRSRDRVILPILPQKSKAREEMEALGLVSGGAPYPEEIRQLLSTQQGIELAGETPSLEEMETILRYITQVNRGSLWNAGSRWLQQAREPGGRFAGLRVHQALLPWASPEEEAWQFRREETRPRRVTNILMNTERNLYLIGSGGIGKTTALLSVMEAAYGEDDQGRVERNRLMGQVPLFVELSGAPDVVPASSSGREWQVYREGRSTFIHRAIYRQIRRDLRLRQINETSLDQIDEVYKADYDVAVKPIVSLFSGETPAPEYILLLDGLNEISRREITYPGAEGEPAFRRTVADMVIEEIREIMRYKNVRVILTSRSREAGEWADAMILNLAGVKPDTVLEYLSWKNVPESRIQAALSSERLMEALRIPLFLTLYAELAGEDELLTAGEILCLFFHQKKQGDYTQRSRAEEIHLSVKEASEGYEPASRLTPQMIGFILDFILPRIGWEMARAREITVRRDRMGDNGPGLDDMIADALTDTGPESACGRWGVYVFEEYSNEIDGDTAQFAENMVSRLGGMKKAVSAVLYCAVMTLGVLFERDHRYGFTHHHLRDYFAAVHQINQMRLGVYLNERGQGQAARSCLKDWQARPLPAEIRRFLGEALGEAHNVPFSDEYGARHYAVPRAPCDRNLIKRAFDLYRGRFDGKDGCAVWNLLQVLKETRGDLSGADFSALDLSSCEANGSTLGKQGCAALLRGAKLTEDFLMPRGHSHKVCAAFFSPDGQRAVTASEDCTAKIWDAETMRELHTLRGHTDAVCFACFSPDGLRIATASQDHTVVIWDAGSLRRLGVLTGHEGAVYSACFSPDGQRVITASEDKTVRLWDAETMREAGALTGFSEAAAFAVFSPDGQRVVTGGPDFTAKVWDGATLREIGTLAGHEGLVRWADFSPDGRRIVTASWDETAKVWDSASLREIGTLRGHGSAVVSAQYSPDGRHILTASWDHTAIIWDGNTLREINTLSGHHDYAAFAAYSPDGRRIVTASRDRTAMIWDAETARKIGALQGYSAAVRFVCCSPDGSLFASACADHTVALWDAYTLRMLGALKGHEGAVNAAGFSPDGGYLVTASEDHTARVWNVHTFQEMGSVTGPYEKVCSIGFVGQNWRMLRTYSGTAKEVDEDTVRRITSAPDGAGSIVTYFYSPDGRRAVALLPREKTPEVRDLDTGKTAGALQGHTDAVVHSAFSPSGRYIVTASRDRTAKVWDSAAFEALATLRGHAGTVTSAVFGPDESCVITASADGTIKIWNTENEECVLTLPSVPGLEAVGVDLRSLHPDSRLSDEARERLYAYGAIVDARG